MRYEEISKVIELRGDGELIRKARVDAAGKKRKEEPVENTGTDKDGYLTVSVNGRMDRYHRVVACLAFKMDIPPGIEVDHIDGIRTNNSPDNLRFVTKRENCQNRIEHRTGRLVGCYFDKSQDRWRAQIWINDKRYHLGLYKTELEGHQAYMRAFAVLQALPTVFSRDIPAGLLRSVVRDDTGLVKLFCRDLRKDLTNGFGYDILRLATSR